MIPYHLIQQIPTEQLLQNRFNLRSCDMCKKITV